MGGVFLLGSMHAPFCATEKVITMRLLYGTTTSVVVTVSDLYYGSLFYLYFADNFNAWPQNPPSSNPFQIFLDYTEIFRTNDINNPKFIAHIRGVKSGIRKKLAGPSRRRALQTVSTMGTHAIQPYLAILEAETYQRNHVGASITPLLPPATGSPTSVEYLLNDIQGPKHSAFEMHLQKLHF